MATPIGNVGATTPTTTTPTTSGTNSAGFDKDTFLKLLVAQLKYQDPSNPTDSSTFMAQTAQFTMVEKMEAMTDSQTAVASATSLQSATALVGKQVTYLGTDGAATTGLVGSFTITDGTPTLQVGGVSVDISQIQKVENPTT